MEVETEMEVEVETETEMEVETEMEIEKEKEKEIQVCNGRASGLWTSWGKSTLDIALVKMSGNEANCPFHRFAQPIHCCTISTEYLLPTAENSMYAYRNPWKGSFPNVFGTRLG